MASFQFTARDSLGAIVSDMVTAESERAVLDILDRRDGVRAVLGG